MTQPDPRSVRQPQLATSDSADAAGGKVECLGMTFRSDEERRAYFTEKLREKLSDAEFRAIEGFPQGSDEDILALSDPPYYTACPNPFLADFVRCYGKKYDGDDAYHKEPFAVDVSEGKNDSIYNVHPYHTKVPHKAIMRYILHYTDPGDIVLDGFAGSGMTGVAAQLCASPDPELRASIEQEAKMAGARPPRWGARVPVLGDLSPAATFIADNYNSPVDLPALREAIDNALAAVCDECGWMYETRHADGTSGRINFTLWSDVFVCPQCGSDIVFWDAALDTEAGKVRDVFNCPRCSAELDKGKLTRRWETYFDPSISQPISRAVQVPVLINYSVSGHRGRFSKTPDQSDLDTIAKIEHGTIPHWFPTSELPDGYNTTQPKMSHGLTHVHHFYTRRNLWVLASLWEQCRLSGISYMQFIFTSAHQYCNRLCRLHVGNFFNGGGGVVDKPLSNTLYMPSLSIEVDAIERFALRSRFPELLTPGGLFAIGTSSATCIDVPDGSIDYIFVDPPFGGNIMYSDLNSLWEGWLKVVTNNEPEAITNSAQGKGLREYQHIMERCFKEYHRVLKPGRWMTVEFSNTKAAVWNALQTALEHAGFVVSNVSMLDKQKGSFKAVTTPTAVRQDLIISCYKPNSLLEANFAATQGDEIGVWEFVRSHLRYLPTFLGKGPESVEIVDRTPRVLYDRLVAYFVQHGYAVPISSQEFQAGLTQRFPQRDGMYFLQEQVAEYERKRLSVREIQQLTIFVKDESTAIQWLRQQLTNKPQTTSELTPLFIRELSAAWDKHELQPELSDLLEQNFLRYDGDGAIPAQIVGWMKKSAELRELLSALPIREDGGVETTSAKLLAAARDRWYVPDPNKAIDLEKLRTKMLLREFAEYANGKGKLKLFRTEAVRAGFAQAWRERDYSAIVRVADRLPESVLQEDPDLLMYYDNASMRVG